MLARQLAGRVWRAATELVLVRGEPDHRVLRRALLRVLGGEAPSTPLDLGFAAHELSPVTPRGLTSRARALERWRRSLDEQTRARRKDNRLRRRLCAWRDEVQELTAQLGRLRDWQGPGTEPGEVGGASPMALSGDLEARLSAWRRELRGTPGASGAALLGPVAWAGGEEALASLGQSLVLVSETAPSERVLGFLAALVAAHPLAGGLPRRLVRIEEELPPDWKGQAEAYLSALLSLVEKPGYPELVHTLGACQSWPGPEELVWCERLVRAGAGPRDLDWLATLEGTQHLRRLAEEPTSPVAPLRRLHELLAPTPGALEGERLALLLRDLAEHGRSSSLEAFVEWLEGLPPEVLAGRRAREVSGLLTGIVLAGQGRPELEGAVARWARPRGRLASVPGEPPALARGKGEDARELRKLLRTMGRYQRWAGQEVRIPGSVRDQLARLARRTGERVFLEGREQTGELTPAQAERLAHLRGEEGPRDPLAPALNQARRLLPRVALDTLREHLDSVLGRRWGERIGREIPGLGRERRLELLSWMEGLTGRDARRLDEILAAFRKYGPEYRRHLEVNQPWWSVARAGGVDLSGWLSPAPRRVEAGGEVFTLEVSRDPCTVFLMGSFFDTCLGLRTGFNRLSVLGNASEANKAVLLVRAPGGAIHGRKLVALDPDLRMLGYHSYLADPQGSARRQALEVAVSAYCRDWARGAGVERADRGVPANLAGCFWYDDEPVAWGSTPGDGPPSLPSAREARARAFLGEHFPGRELPGDREERRELLVDVLLEIGRREEDPELLAELGALELRPHLARRRKQVLLAAGAVSPGAVPPGAGDPGEWDGLRDLPGLLLRDPLGRELPWSSLLRKEDPADWLPVLLPALGVDPGLAGVLGELLGQPGRWPDDAARESTLLAAHTGGWEGELSPAGLRRTLTLLGSHPREDELLLLGCLPALRRGRSGALRRRVDQLAGTLARWSREEEAGELGAGLLALSNPTPALLRFLRERIEDSPVARLALALVAPGARGREKLRRVLRAHSGELASMWAVLILEGDEEGSRLLRAWGKAQEARLRLARDSLRRWQRGDLAEPPGWETLFSRSERYRALLLLAACLRNLDTLLPGAPGERSMLGELLVPVLLPWAAASGRRALFRTLWQRIPRPSWWQVVTLSALHPDRPTPDTLLEGKRGLELCLGDWCIHGQVPLPREVPLEWRDWNWGDADFDPVDPMRLRELLERVAPGTRRALAQQRLGKAWAPVPPLLRLVLEEWVD